MSLPPQTNNGIHSIRHFRPSTYLNPQPNGDRIANSPLQAPLHAAASRKPGFANVNGAPRPSGRDSDAGWHRFAWALSAYTVVQNAVRSVCPIVGGMSDHLPMTLNFGWDLWRLFAGCLWGVLLHLVGESALNEVLVSTIDFLRATNGWQNSSRDFECWQWLYRKTSACCRFFGIEHQGFWLSQLALNIEKRIFTSQTK